MNNDNKMHRAAASECCTPADARASVVTAECVDGMTRHPMQPGEVIQHLGRLTRALHEALSGLGYDKKIEAAAQQLPDARERLAHIANLTWLAAERVLSAVEESQNLQQEVNRDATSLLERWQTSMHFGASPSELAEDTCAFLDRAIVVSTSQGELLQDIMMAQDFHDLTGQVIKRVGALAQDLEKNLLELLIETAPEAAGSHSEAPVSATMPRPDTKVHSQAEVDALLDSLGF